MRSRRLAVLGAALLALASCGRPAVEARPALWRVSDGDTTVWLLGSIHLLPDDVRWRTPAIERAIGEADTLVLESSPDERADFDGFARGAGLKPVADRVLPGKRAVLDAMIVQSGASRSKLDGYDDWAVATMLETGGAIADGASVDKGVETILWRTFDRPNKTRTAFYRVEDQLRQLDALPPELQRQMLDDTLTGKGGYGEALKAWETGDLTTLERHATCTPLDGRLVGQPNDRWSKWIAWRMRRPGTLLIAVGLGHLVGPYALPGLLAARGLKVERVQ